MRSIIEFRKPPLSSQPIAGRVRVKESSRSSWRKLQADDSVVTEMVAVHLHATGNVTCSFTCERYTSLLEQSIILVLQIWPCDTTTMFMQDAASPHIAHCVNHRLHHHLFKDKIISRQFPTSWSPRSRNLNLCDIWLWGYLKAIVYCDPIASLFNLKGSIECHVHNIPQFMLLSTVEHAVLCFKW